MLLQRWAAYRPYVHADRKSNMQYMRALFVSEEPQQDAPEKMSGLLQDFKAKSERRSHGPRILGLTGPDVTKVRQSGPTAFAQGSWLCVHPDAG